MNPDVVSGIDDLARGGVLTREVAPRLRRVAAGRLVSVRGELQALLYAGVLLVATGAGLLVKENLGRIGPLAIALALGLAAAACLVWVGRRAPPFAWREATSPDLAFDYVLLLGALLAVADLAFVEAKFTPLGASWPWHLLVVAVAYAGLALRYDSRTLFSLALTSFAAWRGVRIWFVTDAWVRPMEDRLWIEALIVGGGFVLLGAFLRRSDRKAHFEPVASWMGWILVLGAWSVRSCESGRQLWYEIPLLGCGALLAWFSFEDRRIGLMSLGTAAAGLGGELLVLELGDALDASPPLLYVLLIAVAAAVVAILHRADRALGKNR